MSNPPAPLWANIFLLLPALGVTGSAFAWLVFQTVTPRRTGWLTAVAVPAALASYTAVAVLPRIPGLFPPNPAPVLLGLAVALGAGLLFDQASSLQLGEGQFQGRRSPWPLLLWGAGMVLYVAAPALGRGPGNRPSLDRWAGAVGLVGAFALVGQALGWVWRLSRGQRTPAAAGQPRAAGGLRRLASGTVGAAAALAACWLALPAVPPLSSPAGRPDGQGRLAGDDPSPPTPAQVAAKKAPANSLLVTGRKKTGKAAELFVLDLNTGRYQSLQLAGTGARWSPDGTRLAFIRTEGKLDHLWVAAADGSGSRRLTHLPGSVIQLVWSADSRQIYFVYARSSIFAPAGLWVVPAAGGTAAEVLSNSEGVTFPALSPDGRTLAYRREGPVVNQVASPHEIKLLDLSNRRAQLVLRLPNPGWIVTGLAWAPDGQTLIAGTSERYNDPYQLMRIPLANSQLQPLGPSFPPRPFSFTLVAHDTLALCTRLPPEGGAPGKREIWQVALANGTRRPLRTDGSVAAFSIQASPVGRPAK